MNFNTFFTAESVILICLYRIYTFALGDPQNDKPNPSAILFFISYWLAKKAMGEEIKNYKHMERIATTTPLKNEYRLLVFQEGKKFFTWQHAAGMCPICSFFWVSLFFLLLPNPTFEGLIVFAVANLINKFIYKYA